MERQKVLYVARTKTAKVIRPTSMTLSFPSPSSDGQGTEPFYAPLASVEPELVVTTKMGPGRDTPSRGRQARMTETGANVPRKQRPISDTETFRKESSPKEVDNSSHKELRDYSSHKELRDNSSHKELRDNSSHKELRDNSSHKELRDNSSHKELRDNSSHKELRDNSNRRIYVKPRATNIADTHNENPGAMDNHKINKMRDEPCLSPPESKPRSTIEYDLSNCDHALPINISQNVRRDEVSRSETNNSNGFIRADKKAHRNGSIPIVYKNNVRSPDHNFAKTPPPVAPKPKNTCTTSTVVSDFKQHFPISDNDSRTSKLNSTQCPVTHQNGSRSSKENHIGPSPTLSESILGVSQAGKDKPHSMYKPGRNGSHSLQNLPASSAQRKSRDGPGLVGEHSSTNLLPETTTPVKFQLDTHPLPEMYTKSPPLNTTAIRPVSARVAAQHTSHVFQSRSGPRKPLALINTSFNTPMNSVAEQSSRVRHAVQNATESNRLHTQTIVLNRKQSVDNISNIPQEQQGSSDISDYPQEQPESTHILPEPEFRNSRKRNSMRLATFGYTSMSDLTVSMENLADQPPDVTAKEYSQNQNEFMEEDQLGQGEVCAKPQYKIQDAKDACDSASVTSDHESPIYYSMCDSNKQTEKPTTDDDELGRINSLEQPVLLERNGINRLSYRMATSSISDLSILCDDLVVHSNNSHQTRVIVKNKKNNDSNLASLARRSRDKNTLESDYVRRNGPSVIGNVKHQTQAAHRHTDPYLDLDESTYTLKRLSFTLATASMSDLTFPYDEYNRVLIPHKATNHRSDDTNTTGSSNSSGVHTSESSQQGKLQEGSCYSSGRHSSFGSVYSFKSLDNSKMKSPHEKVVSPGDRHQARLSTDVKDIPFQHTSYVEGDSLDSDGNASSDTTLYYTASDTSFITTDVHQLNSTTHQLPSQSPSHHKKNLHTTALEDPTPPMSSSQNQKFNLMSPHDLRGSRQPTRDGESPKSSALDEQSPRLSSCGCRSPRLPVPDRRPEIDTNNPHKHLNLKLDSLHHKTNSQMLHGQPLKQSTPVIDGLHCHANGSCDRSATAVAHFNRDIAQATSNNNQSPKKCHCSIDGLTRDQCKHLSERDQHRRTESSPKHLPIQMLTPADLSHYDLSSSLSSSSSFCSLTSSGDDATREDTPRFPPSLGKPRRKLYAGFDSQPLPMDSFISDSSSIYSMQTCGSSRSAEVESSSRAFTPAPNVRAVSSIVSSTHAPVRCISQEEMLDLFKYTDKVVPARENNHNIYFDDRFKDNCYDKTFSSESLESFRSDDTIVGSNHALEYTKLRVATKPGSWSVYNNAGVDRHDKTGTERRNLDKLNNSHGLDFGSRLSNNTFVGGNVVNSKNQLKTVKGKKSAQPFCMCRQSSLDPFIVPDGTVTVIRTDTGQWDISM